MEAHVPVLFLRQVEGRARPSVVDVPFARIVPPHPRNKLALDMFVDGVYIRPMVLERFAVFVDAIAQ